MKDIKWLPLQVTAQNGEIHNFTVKVYVDKGASMPPREEARKIIRDCVTLDILFPLPKNSLIN